MNLREPEDRSDTVRISGRRFEESPHVSGYDGPELVRGVCAGRFFPIFNGEDPVRKCWILRRRALIVDVPEKPVEVSGPDAVALTRRSGWSAGSQGPPRNPGKTSPSLPPSGTRPPLAETT